MVWRTMIDFYLEKFFDRILGISEVLQIMVICFSFHFLLNDCRYPHSQSMCVPTHVEEHEIYDQTQ